MQIQHRKLAIAVVEPDEVAESLSTLIDSGTILGFTAIRY